MSKPSASFFARTGEQFLGRSYTEMDCQAFVEKTLDAVGVHHDWSGANAMGRDMAWIGTPEEAKKKFGLIPPGAWLFIHAFDGKEPAKYRNDGIGNYSHVGYVTGQDDGAIHSSATRRCVAHSVFRGKTVPNGGWNRVGFCKLLDYGEKIERILYGTEKQQGQDKKEDARMGYYAMVETENGGALNFRVKPSTSARFCGASPIPNGTVVEVLKDVGEWSRVTYKRQTGYVRSEYLRDYEDVSEDEEPDTPDVQDDDPQEPAHGEVSRAEFDALARKVEENNATIRAILNQIGGLG